MKINTDKNSGWHYMNKYGVVINTDDGGTGDSLGRTAQAMVVYDEDRIKLMMGGLAYFTSTKTSPETGCHIYVSRYPNDDTTNYLKGNSRDHVCMFVSCVMEVGDNVDKIWLKHFLKNRAKRPCIDHPYTIDQKAWFRALFSKGWSWVYLGLLAPQLILAYPWNWWWRLVSGTLQTIENPGIYYLAHKFPNKTFIYNVDELKEWQKRLYKLIVPTFAYYYTAWMVRGIESKPARKILQFLLRYHFEKDNYVGRWLTGLATGQVPDNYIPSRKMRWSIRLDRGCDRDVTPFPRDKPENNLELGLFEYIKKH